MTTCKPRIVGRPIDATLVVHPGMELFPGDPSPEIIHTSRLDAGDPFEVSKLRLGCHTGTHVDMPGHFVAGGKMLEDYDLDELCGRVVVLDCAAAAARVDSRHLRIEALHPRDHVVLRTRNTLRRTSSEYSGDAVVLGTSAAELLAQVGIATLGFDHYSLDPAEDHKCPAHRIFAEHGVPVVVMLDLRKVPPGAYYWVVAPLRLRDVEGAPARVLFFPAEFD